jgi:hypothetical protein
MTFKRSAIADHPKLVTRVTSELRSTILIVTNPM